LHADVARPWTVASLAEEARLSRTAFSERFTRFVGMPPMTYLIKWRMAVAKDILQRERLPQDVVAATVGYQSASAFSTAFRREVGQAPGEYARANLAQTV
jgi:AraC-like DNA-binding protein